MKIGIRILIGCAVLLSFLIIAERAGGLSRIENFLREKSSPVQKESVPRNEKVEVGDTAHILTPPGATATEAEHQAYFNLVQNNAKEADALKLGAGCVADPLVFKAGFQKTFVVKNIDASAHTFVLDKDHMYKIEAGEEKKLSADFGHGPGIYGYGCDSSPTAAGMIFISK